MRLLVRDGYTFERVARLTQIHFSSCYRYAARVTTRPRKPLTYSERLQIQQALLQRPNEPLRRLAREFERDSTVIAQIRREVLPFEAQTTRRHRCPDCGAVLTAPDCLRCALVQMA